ncbi:hypothetical protein J437_LFUL006056 [Ladona fulva]|uniref:Integrase zinc-binding domain-containing protein n=1 Tax=Ladona fulva TaxID=123851 RepID=A0A8K0NVC7_LADFU|nr:hypothetical protein J437_LFUL006056 [Ladona fulva]
MWKWYRRAVRLEDEGSWGNCWGGCLSRPRVSNVLVIPEALRCKILNELHSSHLGIAKMKYLARSYV